MTRRLHAWILLAVLSLASLPAWVPPGSGSGESCAPDAPACCSGPSCPMHHGGKGPHCQSISTEGQSFRAASQTASQIASKTHRSAKCTCSLSNNQAPLVRSTFDELRFQVPWGVIPADLPVASALDRDPLIISSYGH